ncbi:MAG: hypothetical protein UR20_C0054G0014 [Candidatus Woesebacteria bacterium GW2011_GWE2_31_6]|nr:MAG: hypothetical protein UR20_C0054G0014 [Candidatus Woesebacteria bacterium GW2011_GWE2_31_6]
MKPNSIFDRLKKKIISRLTDEVDIYYFNLKEQIDNKVAKLTYRDREIIVDGKNNSFVLYLRHGNGFNFRNYYGYQHLDKEEAIENAKILLKDDEVWR